ncbi:hypothetical protein GINT2_002097 [Glugoides intestinalis]
MKENKSNNDKLFFLFTIVFISVSYFLVAAGMMKVTHHWITNVAVIYMLISNIFSFYNTTYITPGFLPFKSIPAFELQSCYLKNSIGIFPDVLNNSRLIVIPSEKSLKTTYVQKYCMCCNSFRPIRTSHCSDCGRCIIDKDHHCIWLNTCIGRNNYKFFLYFLYTLCFISLYNVSSLRDIYIAQLEHRMTIIIFGAFFISLSTVLILFSAYHTLLSILNTTSREFLNTKGTFSNSISFIGLIRRMSTIKPLIENTKEDV